MAMRPTKATLQQKRIPRAQRGAALMFALVTVLIISVVIAGVWNVVTSHTIAEESGRGYARAIHIAEAAANWQLNRMSRSLPPANSTAAQGYMTYNDFQALNPYTSSGAQTDPNVAAIPTDDSGSLTVKGFAKNVLTTAPDGTTWTPPYNFVLKATGHDPVSGVERTVQFNGTATCLGDRYTLFGDNGLTFVGGTTTNCNLLNGFIGTNGTLNWTGQAPNSSGGASGYGGVRLGGSGASLAKGTNSWPAGWDFLRLPDTVYWPSVDAVAQYSYGVSQASDLANQASHPNPSAQMWYLAQDVNSQPVWAHFATTPTQLTDAEFALSPYRTICLSASLDSTNGNLFTFSRIDMSSSAPGVRNTLVLDYRMVVSNGAQFYPPALRVLITGDASNNANVITNLAYASASNPRYYLFFNNSGRQLSFTPYTSSSSMAYNILRNAATAPVLGSDGQQLFTVRPQIRGLVYSPGSDVSIFGDPTAKPGTVLINSVIARNITIDSTNCAINVSAAPIEPDADGHRFVLYYRIQNLAKEINTNGADRTLPFDYGTYTP